MTYKIPVLLLAISCAAQSTEPPPLRKLSFGGRIRILGNSLFDGAPVAKDLTSPFAHTRDDSTENQSSRGAVGLGFEYALTKKWAIGVDAFYQRARYVQSTTILRGSPPDEDDTDDRDVESYTERTRATFWDVPVTMRYYGLRDEGPLSKIFVSAGGAARFTRSVKSGTESILPGDGDADGTVEDGEVKTAYNETPVSPRSKQTFGATVGVGFRFIDDYRIRFTPEFRYTHWFGAPFDSNSTRTRRGQMEIVIGISF